jgi:hypothetical protein
MPVLCVIRPASPIGDETVLAWNYSKDKRDVLQVRNAVYSEFLRE